jgi:hypothetical protein
VTAPAPGSTPQDGGTRCRTWASTGWRGCWPTRAACPCSARPRPMATGASAQCAGAAVGALGARQPGRHAARDRRSGRPGHPHRKPLWVSLQPIRTCTSHRRSTPGWTELQRELAPPPATKSPYAAVDPSPGLAGTAGSDAPAHQPGRSTPGAAGRCVLVDAFGHSTRGLSGERIKQSESTRFMAWPSDKDDFQRREYFSRSEHHDSAIQTIAGQRRTGEGSGHI